MKIFNGENLLLGRLCSQAAKELLSGEEVRIINCEKVWVSGNKVVVLTQEKRKIDRKGYPPKSQKRNKIPFLFVKRTVRGMLPYKTTRGKEAYKRLKCYAGMPEEFKDKKTEIVKKADIAKLPLPKTITVEEICNWLKGKK